MITVRGSITKKQEKVDAVGAYVLFVLQPQQGQSIPVVWRGPTSVTPGEIVDATGDLDHEGYLLAASLQKWEAPKPPPAKPQRYVRRDVFRAIGAAILGDIIALVMALVLAPKAKDNAVTWTILVVLGITFSAGLAWLFAGENRKANAILGGAMAVLTPLGFYLLFLLVRGLGKVI